MKLNVLLFKNILFMRLKIFIKSILTFFNIKIIREEASLNRWKKNFNTKNITIELMGPSGIGKTTLHSKVGKMLNYKWNLKYLTNIKLPKEDSFKLGNIYRISLFLKGSNLYKTEKDFKRYMNLMLFFIKNADRDHNLKSSGILNKGGAFLEDGFCHNFAEEIIEIIEKKLVPDEELYDFFEGRRFVLLEAPVNYVVENLRKRQENRKENRKDDLGNDILSVFGEQNIMSHVQKDFFLKRKFLKLSSRFGARYWILNKLEEDKEVHNAFKLIESKIIGSKILPQKSENFTLIENNSI